MSEEALMAALADAGVVDEQTTDAVDDVSDRAAAEDDIVEAGNRPAVDVVLDLDDVEIEARAKGWNPNRDEYEKATGRKWSSAETFLARREMADEISKRGHEIKSMRREMERLRKQMDSRVEEEVSRRVAELKKERADAIRTQDFEEIERLDNEIEEAKKPRVVEDEPGDDQNDVQESGTGYIESPAQVQRYLEKWKRDEAPWFDKANKTIQAEAARIEKVYMQTYPNSSIEESLAYVNEHMVKRFPELSAFGKKLQTGGAPRGGGGGQAVDESSLSAADKMVLRQLEKSGAFKDAKDKAAFIRENFGA